MDASTQDNCIMGTKQIVKVIILDPLKLCQWLRGGGGKILILCLTPHLPSSQEFPAEGNKHKIISIIFINSWTNLKQLMTSKSRTPLVNSDWVQAQLQRLTELSYFLQINLILGLWNGPIAPPANQLHAALTQTPEHCFIYPIHTMSRESKTDCCAQHARSVLSCP